MNLTYRSINSIYRIERAEYSYYRVQYTRFVMLVIYCTEFVPVSSISHPVPSISNNPKRCLDIYFSGLTSYHKNSARLFCILRILANRCECHR